MNKHSEWENPRSYINERKNEKGEVYYEGSLYYNEIEFHLTARPQQTGKYLYRGRVSAISPQTGKLMKTIKHSESGEKQSINISTEIYFNAAADLEKSALNAADRLCRENGVQMARELQHSIRPNTITPSCAAILYAKPFVESAYKGAKQATAVAYIGRIQRSCSRMPQSALAQYRETVVREYYRRDAVSTTLQKLLHRFGEYLLDNGHVQGVNPFPQIPDKKPTAKNKQNGVKIIGELDLDMQDAMYQMIQNKESPSGGDCGIALMLWGGFSADAGLTWRMVDLFGHPYVVAMCRKEDYAGATHNYDRVLFPQAADILRRRYKHLGTKYSEEQLADMPIVSQDRNPKCEMNAAALHQYAGVMLRKIGIGEATFAAGIKGGVSVPKSILATSYKKNVELRIGLQSDEGRRKYLQAMSLRNNVTDDNYTSFADEDARAGMYRAMQCMQPLRELEQPTEEYRMLEGGEKEYRYVPDTTREIVGIIGEVVIPPGGCMTIVCQHGVTGRMQVREVLPDGTAKRKGKKKTT